MTVPDGTASRQQVVAVERLSDPALRCIVDELARRFSASPRPVRSISVTLDEPARQAVAGLLGLPRLPPATGPLRCDRIAAAVQLNDAELREVIATLVGGIGDRSGAAAAARAALGAATSHVAAVAAPLGESATLWAAAQLRTLPGALDDRVSGIDTVCAVLVAQQRAGFPRRPLAVIAAAMFGDPHRLDLDSPTGGLLLRAAAAAHGQPAPAGAAASRAALARFGIAADELSSTVTTWALLPQNGHPYAGASRELTAAGEPVVWTLSTVANHPVTSWPQRVLVVENPAVLAVAAGHGFDGTLVCSSGQPTVAVAMLIAQAVAAGCRVDVHADFDPAGLGITAWLAAAGGQPWKMGADDYAGAMHLSQVRSSHAVPLTPWDPRLHEVFTTERRIVFEEQIIDHLLL